MNRKFIACAAILIALTMIAAPAADAQILNKIKKRVQSTAENKVLNKAEAATSKSMDEAEKSAKGKKKKGEQEVEEVVETDKEASASKPVAAANAPTLIQYANYDFVPGDKIIFQYNFEGEKDTEIPGRLLLDQGSAEIQSYQGEKVLYVPADNKVYLSPLMNDEAYLPEQFSVEFDVLSNGGIETSDATHIRIYFREADENTGDYGSAHSPILIGLFALSGSANIAQYAITSYTLKNRWVGTERATIPKTSVNDTQNNWRHVSIYVNKNIGKLYLDQHRIGMINQIESGRSKKLEILVNTETHPVMFRNFRIAAGGSDSYQKIITEGKYIAYGIQFDVNKSVLKPESMGSINELASMMQANPDLHFEIGGHTDSDGSAESNNSLSLERAEAVKKQLVTMGIAANRLSCRGYGASKSIEPNNSPENKAKNRRVEFVKK